LSNLEITVTPALCSDPAATNHSNRCRRPVRVVLAHATRG